MAFGPKKKHSKHRSRLRWRKRSI